ncbi:MAG: hypothetical protein ACRC2V_26425 [Xenococcaceae cyanobacterium]
MENQEELKQRQAFLIRELNKILEDAKKPNISTVQPLVDAYYRLPSNGSGGSLHIVLEDNNVQDSSVYFCIEWAKKDSDIYGVLLGEVLLRMSKTQRLKLRIPSVYYY